MSLNEAMGSCDLDLGLSFSDSQVMDSQMFEGESNFFPDVLEETNENMEIECNGKTDQIDCELQQSVSDLALANKDFNEAMDYRRKLDDMAVQVKQAVLLRQEVGKCASERKESLPLVVSLQVFPTTNGPFIVYCEIDNRSEHDLNDWTFTFTFQCALKGRANEAKRKGSYSVRQKCIYAGKAATTQIHVADVHQFPVLVSTHATKAFNFSNHDSYVVRIQLDPIVLTRWELFVLDSPCVVKPSARAARAVLYQTKPETVELKLPDCAAYLLCDKKATPEALFDFIFRSNPAARFSSQRTIPISGFIPVDSNGNVLSAQLKIERRMKDLVIILEGKNTRDLESLRMDLQIKILHSFSRIRRRPVNGIESVIDKENLNTMFSSTMANFV